MAIYHCSIKPVQRSTGRSATGSAAYRASEKIIDERTGLIHDYTRKAGVDHVEIIGFDGSRAVLWNLAEKAERRKDATTAREYEIALPEELNKEKQVALTREYGEWLHQRHGCAVDVCLHDLDSDNPHAHILTTTREIVGTELGDKIAREWSDTKRKKKGFVGRKADLQEAREKWELVVNKHLELANEKARIDHRTLEAQGIERKPQIHLGPNVIKMEENGITTDRGTEAIEIEKTNAQILELERYREAIEHERNIEIKKSEKHRGASHGDRAISSGDGAARGRDTADTERSAESQCRTSPAMESTAAESSRSDATGGTGERNSSRGIEGVDSGSEREQVENELENLLADARSERNNSAGATDRIVNLVRARAETPGRGDVVDNESQRPLERTILIVKRQLEAMKCKVFEVGIRENLGKMMTRIWGVAEVLKSVPWLKRENAKGADIYIRPSTVDGLNQGLLLVDGLTKDSLQVIKQEGFEPSVVVETSPQNYQAWVRLSDSKLSPEVAAIAAKAMANKFEVDSSSAESRRFGMLAGFTNRTPEHTTESGRNPRVLCHEASGQQASRGIELTDKVEKMVLERYAEQEQRTLELKRYRDRGPSL